MLQQFYCCIHREPTVVAHSDPRGVPGETLRWHGMVPYDVTVGQALLVLTLPPVIAVAALNLPATQLGNAHLGAGTSGIWPATLMQRQPEELDLYGTWRNPAFERLLYAAMRGQMGLPAGAR